MVDSKKTEAFVFLNLLEFEINHIKHFSLDFTKLIV